MKFVTPNRVRVFHPFLFGIYPVLFLLGENVGKVWLKDTFIPLVCVVAVTAIVYTLLYCLFRDHQKAGIVTAAFLILFFSYGHFYQILLPWFSGPLSGFPPITRYLIWIFGIFVFPLSAVFIGVLRIRRTLGSLTKLLNVIALVLVLAATVKIAAGYARAWDTPETVRSIEEFKVPEISTQDGSPMPDIYYIILDGYGNLDALKEFYDFSNEGFYEALEQRGFYAPRNSRSNYDFTLQSLASTLDMAYIQDLRVGDSKEYFFDWPWLAGLIQDNRVVSFLRAKGYRYFHLGSAGFTPTSRHPKADQNFNFELINEFSKIMLRNSLLEKAEIAITAPERHRNVFYQLEMLHTMPSEPSPKFVFAHFMVPHPPFIFDAEGRLNSVRKLVAYEGRKRKGPYTEQVVFINRELLKLVDAILEKSKTPPVIILQGDHGPRSGWRGDLTSTDFDSAESQQAYVKERSGILNAYYLPRGGNQKLKPGVTPVNTFRIIFNHFFGTDYPYLENKHYISNPEHGFVEVTEVP